MKPTEAYDPSDDNKLGMLVGVAVMAVLGTIFWVASYSAPPHDDRPSFVAQKDQERLNQIVAALAVPNVLIKCSFFSKKGRITTCHILTPDEDRVVAALLANGWRNGDRRVARHWGMEVGWDRTFHKEESKFVYGCYTSTSDNYCYVQLLEPYSL